jgi:arabinofuranosyltransferase
MVPWASPLVIARVIGVMVVASAAVRLAWISDDALITLRSALNAGHGWGAGYNATEAVQAYTHPLWFLLWLGLGQLTGEWVLTVLALGVATSAVGVAILLWSATSVLVSLGATAALLMSNAFMEYTTSGLENGLGYLLIGALIVLSGRAESRPPNLRLPVAIGLLVAALLLTRLDFIVFVAPVGVWLAWQWHRQWRMLAAAIVAVVLPVVAWSAWAHSTYGSLLPNTYAAKRNADIPLAEVLVQGVRYIGISAGADLLPTLVFLAGMAVVLRWGPVYLRLWVAGICTYVAYVVWVGGDFMVGRFLAVPYFALVLLVVMALGQRQPTSGDGSVATRNPRVTRLLATVGSVVVVAAFALTGVPSAVAAPATERWAHQDRYGIADERGHYSQFKRRLVDLGSEPGAGIVSHPALGLVVWSTSIDDLRSAASMWPDNPGAPLAIPDDVIVMCPLLGAAGIMAGPRVHLIDLCGLTDRFLAEATFVPGEQWRIGHLVRVAPDGYVEAVAANNPLLVADASEASRLEKLWSVIRP